MKKYILALIIGLALTGCGPKVLYEIPVTKQDVYKRIYDEKPISILVLPALDKTTSAEASELFSYTITTFLAEKGYYVFSPTLVDEFLKSENITEPQLAREIPIEKIRQVFNPDVILYVDIIKWDTNYKVLSSGVHVVLLNSLISAKTNKPLWLISSGASSVSEGQLDASSPLAFLITAAISATAAAINTGTDYQNLALLANSRSTFHLPLGKYHYNYEKDKTDRYGTLRIFEKSFENFQKERATNPNAKFIANVITDSSKYTHYIYGIPVVVETDQNGNIIEQDGKPIFEQIIYLEEDKNK